MYTIRCFLAILVLFVFSAAPSPAQPEKVNIGFLIPDTNTTAARDGALLAVTEANSHGGIAGKEIHLIVRTTAGPWGTGSKQAVNMIFDYDVVAIVASLDGRNAHLAEQITTKTKVAFISTWSTDMTLSYAFVPWYFRVIPDDKKQAAALYDEISRKKKIRDVLLIGEDTYDARNAIATYVKISGKDEGDIPRQIFLKDLSSKDRAVIPPAGACILFGTPRLEDIFFKQYLQKNPGVPVLGTISLTDDRRPHTQSWKMPENVMVVSSGQWFTEKGRSFLERFSKMYGYEPGPAAAYAYDGISVIIDAVRHTGTNRNRIIGYLSGIRYQGVTGEIRFDDKGNRVEQPRVMIIKNGKPVLL